MRYNPVEGRCKKHVYSGTRIDFGGHQCTRKIYKDGFCKIHQPEAIEQRNKEREIRIKERCETMPMYSKRSYERLERELAEAREQYQMEKAGADQLRVNCRWLIHQLELFNANKQFVKELAEKDTVPRTRYDACNKDWLEERELRKKVQNDSHNIIVDLEAQLAGFNGLYNTDAKLINRLREQLAEKDKQIEEMIHRTLKWIDCNTCPFGNNNDSKCAVNCREKLIHYFKTGKTAEKKARE